MADGWNFCDTFLRPLTKNTFFIFQNFYSLLRYKGSNLPHFCTYNLWCSKEKKGTSGKMLLSEHIKAIIFKAKTLMERWVLGTSNRCSDHLSRQFLTTAFTFPYRSKKSSAEHIHALLYISLFAWVWVRQCVCVCVCVCVFCCLFMWVSLFVMVSHVDKPRICSAEECVCKRVCVCLSMWVSVCLSMWVSVCVYVSECVCKGEACW